ncbi:hypothetical protein HYH03_017769 [Edaphochlamys debaryana]|uniref:Uncharacterized protein n=1 Tax=Edaphochlamys debaryana TaxID=47281 RepID=A0A836BNU3_9CHLO|nr:hypothetical protein HYH03_017769 [Edaphochlamys debaryana]|eukprot:KAG2483370.1 hypothetical protein HYH03_017769 [Edaphochlamys debaryana]
MTTSNAGLFWTLSLPVLLIAALAGLVVWLKCYQERLDAELRAQTEAKTAAADRAYSKKLAQDSLVYSPPAPQPPAPLRPAEEALPFSVRRRRRALDDAWDGAATATAAAAAAAATAAAAAAAANRLACEDDYTAERARFLGEGDLYRFPRAQTHARPSGAQQAPEFDVVDADVIAAGMQVDSGLRFSPAHVSYLDPTAGADGGAGSGSGSGSGSALTPRLRRLPCATQSMPQLGPVGPAAGPAGASSFSPFTVTAAAMGCAPTSMSECLALSASAMAVTGSGASGTARSEGEPRERRWSSRGENAWTAGGPSAPKSPLLAPSVRSLTSGSQGFAESTREVLATLQDDFSVLRWALQRRESARAQGGA